MSKEQTPITAEEFLVNEGSNNFNETFQHIHEQLKPKRDGLS